MKRVLTLSILIILSIFISACTEKRNENTTGKQNSETSDNQTFDESISNTASGNNESSDKTEKIKNIKYGISNVPSSIKNYKGKPVAAATWEDNNGENILIVTETQEKEKPAPDGERFLSKELYGYLFIKNGDKYEEMWKIQDFVKECFFDLSLTVIPESLTITDLDGDGIAENTFLYRLSCKSDVSPDDLKLMMHENKSKYALRGQTLTQGYGGDYTVDKAFNDAPASFLEYAKKQWEEHKVLEY